MRRLTPEQLDYFDANGYVVVPEAVPRENLEAVVQAIWEFLEMDPHNPEDWYHEPHRTGGMVEMYQHQSMWDNRQHPGIYQAFADILDQEKLWVSMDRVCMKPPAHSGHPEYDHKGFIHWDVDTTRIPERPGVQGVLCLTDTTADMGGFQCIPGFHKNLREWVETQPADRNPRSPDMTGLRAEPIPAAAGSLIIWSQLLAHGNGHNTSARPRLAQYITMFPEPRDPERRAKHREGRVQQWRDRLPPRGEPFPGDPRRKEELEGRTAELTPLGRHLLGLDTW